MGIVGTLRIVRLRILSRQTGSKGLTGCAQEALTEDLSAWILTITTFCDPL